MGSKIEQLDQIAEIRNLMEKSSRFISLSGLSGVSAGIFALIGAGVANWYIRNRLPGSIGDTMMREPLAVALEHIMFFLILGTIIFVLAVGSGIYFTTRKARLQNLPVWDNLARLTLVNLAIPLIAGALFCGVLLHYGIWFLIGPATLIFYGLSLLNGSKYTLQEIRYLGVTEIITGFVACFFPFYSLLFWALGFGVFHIIYGIVMYNRYEK